MLSLINDLKWYVIGGLLMVIGVLGVYTGYLKLSNTELQHELDMKVQAEKILADEYVKRSKEADKRNVIVEKEYIVKVRNIDHWYKGEGNATAEDGIKYLDDHVY